MGDREADIYELFAQAALEPAGPKLLIRAQHDRQVQDEQARLFEAIQRQPIAGYQIVKLPRQKNRPAREAKLAIRFAALTLCAPQDKAHLSALEIWTVLAKEEDTPEGVEPIEWRLLTTLAVQSFEQACEKVAWYPSAGVSRCFIARSKAAAASKIAGSVTVTGWRPAWPSTWS
ncbi:MAG: hypothetical protein IPI02_04840 [Sterolibacteriaceae bacterium]|nr:hypothetical protein [Sterolibacteriaceae bacterium]